MISRMVLDNLTRDTTAGFCGQCFVFLKYVKLVCFVLALIDQVHDVETMYDLY